MGGNLFAPKNVVPSVDKFKFLDPRTMWLDHYHLLQLFDGKDALNFSLEREHPIISTEAYGVLETILMVP
jgi:hypothetical protein